jgi:molybdopterin/thiamine biosynthesis adenylyltransferase
MKPIVIVGAGALGSHVVLCARNWAHPIQVVDFDRIEAKNTQAQFHTKMGLGRNKAQALQQAMQGMWGTKLIAIPHKLTLENVGTVLGDAALVLDCTDNIEARQIIQGFVRAKGIPCLHGALSADGSFGRIIWDELFRADPEGAPGQATCEDGETLPFFALAGAQMAVIAQLFLENGEKRSLQMTPTGMIRLA